MIKTVIRPENRNISIVVPQDFVGKQIEVIAFIVEEPLHPTETLDLPTTHFASEKILAKDWLTPEEDLAWQDL